MRVVRNALNMMPLSQPTALTIGNFDGVHRGHAAIVERVRERATRFNGLAAVMSFEPPPRVYFDPANAPPRLTSFRDKIAAFADLDVDVFVCARFNDRLASLSPEAFLQTLVADRLRARYLAVGADFRFGAGRAGDIDTIRRFGEQRDIAVDALADIEIDGKRVSSTRIRQALAAGDLAVACKLLGRDHEVTSRVVRGQRLGRTLGFPTLNLALGGRSPLRYGVYAVRVKVRDGAFAGRCLDGAASFGVRPTVAGQMPLLEIYLLNFSGDLYGARVHVAFRAFLRDEVNYDSLEAMTKQMHRDVENAAAKLSGPS